MEYFNFYYEDFQDEKLNLTDRVILSIINSFNEYEVNYQELNELIGITVSNIKLSVKKLKDLNLVQGNDKLELTNKTQGRYFKVDIEAGLEIKQLLIKNYIISLPNKAFYGSVTTLSNVFYLSNPTVYKLLETMVNNGKINKDKQGKVFKYSIADDNNKMEVVDTETIEKTIEEIPTTDIELLNQRLNKASEVCKQLFTENEKLKADIELLNQKINSLYDRQLKYLNLFQPVIERIDEIDSDVNSIYHLTDNIRQKQETELNMNIMRKYSSELV